MSTHTKAIGAIVIVSILWGTAGIVGKILLQYFDPFFIALIRHLIAAICILPLFLRQHQYPIKKVIRGVVPITSLIAFNIMLYYVGLQNTTVNSSYVIYATTPLLVALISTVTIREVLSKNKFIGILVGFIGILSIFVFPYFIQGSNKFGTPVGNLIIFLAVLGWSAYTVGSRYLTNTKKYSPLYITSISMFASVFIIAFVNLVVPHRIDLNALLRPSIIFTFLYLGLFLTVVTYALYQWAIQRTSSATAALTNYLQPIFAFYFTWIFLGERLTLTFILGSILVLAGVFIATGGKTAEYINAFREKQQNK